MPDEQITKVINVFSMLEKLPAHQRNEIVADLAAVPTKRFMTVFNNLASVCES